MGTLRVASGTVDPGVRAVVLDADIRLCIISYDAPPQKRDALDAVAGRISTRWGIPEAGVLLASTGFRPPHAGEIAQKPDQIEQSILGAVDEAIRRIDDPTAVPNDVQAELGFAVEGEATVTRCARFLLSNGAVGGPETLPQERVRPLGAVDPDVPILLFRRPEGRLAAVLFGHSNSNEAGLYTRVARELEQAMHTAALFLPGATGAAQNLDVHPDEAVFRVQSAVQRGIERATYGLIGPLASIKEPFAYESCRPDPSGGTTWLHVVTIGEIALVGVPGELFADAALDLRRRSPFRHTFVVGFANDSIGLLPDRPSHALGGRDIDPPRCTAAPGTAEALVDRAIGILEGRYWVAMHGSAPPRLRIRRLRKDEGPALQRFYNTLETDARRLFRPLGWNASFGDACKAATETMSGKRYDVVATDGEIVGWAALFGMDKPDPTLGIGISARYRGRGVGTLLMERLIREASVRGKEKINLTVVRTNERARKLYERHGFVVSGTMAGSDGLEYFRMVKTISHD